MRSLVQEVLPHFGLRSAQVKLIALGENAVWRVWPCEPLPPYPPAQSFALRFHRRDSHDQPTLESELRWMQALAGQQTFTLPTPIPTRTGALSVRVADPTQVWHLVTLITWLEGTPWRGERDRQQARILGQALASLHHQVRQWQPGLGFTRWRFHPRHNLGQSTPVPLAQLAQVYGQSVGEQLALALEHCVMVLNQVPQVPAEYGLQHSDLCPDNLIQTPSGLGIIDFNDALYGPLAYDLVVAMEIYLDQAPARLHHGSLAQAVLAGYAEISDLPTLTDDLIRGCYFVRKLGVLSWQIQRFESQVLMSQPPIQMVLQLGQNILQSS